MPLTEVTQQPTVVIADNNSIVRAGIRATLMKMGITSTIEVTDLTQLQNCLGASDPPTILIFNLAFDANALETIKNLTQKSSKLAVLAMGSESEKAYATRVLRAGGVGYLKTDCSQLEFTDAMNAVRLGKIYLTQQGSSSLVEQFRVGTDDQSLHALLSDREHQIFIMICNGTPLVKAGEIFGISVKTVSTYRSRILKKLKVQTNSELIQYAMKHQIIEPIPA